jgi:cytoskeletal protein CcmA (bactofilin family)
MALFVRDDKADRSDDSRTAAGRVAAPMPAPATTTPTRDVQAHLGKGTEIEGKLSFKGSVRIEGQVDGEIFAEDSVILGETAQIRAQIKAATIIVQGKVTGDLTAKTRIELRAPATLVGNIQTPSLVIHEGVVFEGRCVMGEKTAERVESTDSRIAIFPAEDRGNGSRRKSEAVN